MSEQQENIISFKDISVMFPSKKKDITAVKSVSFDIYQGEVFGIVGIGDLAIRFGYYRYQTDVMIITVILLIVLVQIIQMAGDRIAKFVEVRS
ncbi:MAG: hypothetical protein LBS55_09885 [Prevotellaceae bacterium]|jgi:D-methionine transport system permease protein|nr:hypothetical protein [Prevotellaceae bacterium]